MNQPRTIEERCEVARKCAAAARRSIPVLVDDVNDTAATAYCALPSRFFIVSGGGTLAYLGDREKVSAAKLERALVRTLAE